MLAAPGVVGVNDLVVTQNGTPNMSVNVAAGMVWCPGTLGATAGMPTNWNAQTAYGLPTGLTAQGSYCTYNDGTVNLTISAANPSNPRIDLICVAIQDAAYSGSNNTPVLQVITGTAAASPSAPSAPASSVVLAQIAVAAGATSIVTGNITDVRPVALPNALPLITEMVDVIPNYSTTATTPGSGAATWANMGNLVVPTWATQAVVTLSVNGFSGSAANAAALLTLQIGSSVQSGSQRAIAQVASERCGFAGVYYLSGIPTGTQALRVVATFISGTLSIDTQGFFSAQAIYLP